MATAIRRILAAVLLLTCGPLVVATAGASPPRARPACSSCAYDFEDGTTQGWGVASGTGLTLASSKTAYSGSRSLGVTLSGKGGGTIDVEPGGADVLAGLTNGVSVTYHLNAPKAGVVSVTPFAEDRPGFVIHRASAVTLGKGWNTLTWQVPYQSGVYGIGLIIAPVSGFKGQLQLDTVSWPDTFVRRVGTRLQLQDHDYRFDGINIYNANSRADSCWYSMGDNDLLDTSLGDLSGLEVIRAWFFQSLATTGGVRDWSAFDHTLQVAAAHHVKVIATLGNQWGDCETTGYKDLAWYQGGYGDVRSGETTSYAAWVTEVLGRYHNDPTVAFWQLMNEPEARDSKDGTCQEDVAAAALRAFTDDVGGVAHRFDANHLVDVGALGGGQCGMSYTDYELIHASPGTDLCEFHDYHAPTTAIPGDQYNGLQMRLTQCNTDLGKPLFAGETGISVPDEAGTPSERASDVDAKLEAQLGANVVGELLWAWNINCSTACTTYDIGVGDPSVALLSKY